MITGPIPLKELAQLLGTDTSTVETLLTDSVNPLPAVRVPLQKRMKHCVYLEPLCRWLNKTASGMAWTIEMLSDEIERGRAGKTQDTRLKTQEA